MRLISEVQHIRTERARRGEDPCYVPFDPIVDVEFQINRLRMAENDRVKKQRKLLNRAEKIIFPGAFSQSPRTSRQK